MPPYRKLHTQVTQSFDFNEMPDDFTRCLWLLLPLGLDCEGRGIYNSSWIKSKLMPLREDVDGERIYSAMQWYADREMIVRYSVEGRDYFYIPSFKKFQGDTRKEAKSILPAPPGYNSNDVPGTVLDTVPPPAEVLLAASASASTCESTCEYESGNEKVNIFGLYEREIGVLTPMIADALKIAEEEYPPGWIQAAFREAATHNARNWKYCHAILKRWKDSGAPSTIPKIREEYSGPIILPDGRIQVVGKSP